MRVPKTLRRLAVVATTATLLAGVPVTAAQAAETVTNVSPVSGVNTNSLTVTFSTSATYLALPEPTVTFVRAADTSDTIPLAESAVTVTGGNAFSVTVPLTGENPGAWNIKVEGNTSASPVDKVASECASCFTVLAFAPTVSSVAPTTVGGGASGVPFTITGTNFTNDAYCSTGPCTGEPTVTVSGSGVTLTGAATGGAEEATTATAIKKKVNVAPGAATGPRDVTVTNTDGKSATCTGCLVVGPTPTMTAITPAAIAKNASTRNIVITGTNFASGATVAMRVPNASTDDANITLGTPVVDSPTQITVPVTVNNATAGDRLVTVTNPDKGAVASSTLFDVNEKPTVTSVAYTENSGVSSYGQGAVNRTLTITGTGFQNGATVSFNNPAGITIDSTTVTNATTIAVDVTLAQTDAATAPATGDHAVTVSNPDGGVSGSTQSLSVSKGPKLTGVSPASRGRGETVTLTLTGSDFNAGGITVEIPDVTVTSTTVTNATTATVSGTVGSGLNIAGVRDVTVTNNNDKGRYVCVGCFAIDNLQVNTISPANVLNDSTQSFTITGSGFTTDAVATLVKAGSGAGMPDVTGTTTSVNGAGTSMTVTFPLTGAAPGDWRPRVTNPATNPGTGTCTCLLTVVAPTPNVSAVTPNTRGAGADNETITITGSGFAPGATLTFTNPGVHVVGAPTVTPTQITAVIDIDHGSEPDALQVPQPPTPTVTVTNTDGQNDSATFTVTAGPTTSAVDKSTRARGSASTVTVSGTDFVNGATIIVSGTGVTAGPTTFTDANGVTETSDKLAATFTVAPDAPLGARSVTVRNPDGGRHSCASCTLTITEAPTVTSVTPSKLPTGKATTVTITGTGFASSPTVSAGSGVVTGTVTRVSATTITAVLTPDANATLGNRSLTVTNTDAGSATLADALKVITVPGKPTAVSATRGAGQATVTWTAPSSTGNDPITGYTVTSSPGGKTATVGGDATQATVTDLTNGTAYTFTVVATNAAGDSAASDASAPVTPATVPDAPTAVSATSENAQSTVSWTAPASNGGSDITSYTVTSSPGGKTATTLTGATTQAVVTGLDNGTAYTFTVVAKNAVGDSAASAPSTAVTPATVPDAPANVGAAASDASALVTWNAPAFDGGSPVTSYTVTSSPGNHTATTPDGSTLSANVTGLTNGTKYTFTVVATNAKGAGAASSASPEVTPFTIPGAPTAVSATAGAGQATVTWTAPASNGGDPVTGYTVTSSPGGKTASVGGDATEATVTGLTNGTAYTFTVVAKNAAGDSAPSAASNSVTPVTVPGAPTGVSATAGELLANVSWTAPESNGGSAITGYTVTAAPGGATANADATSTTAVVEGLVAGTAYTFTVVATNAQGSSAASGASDAVTVYDEPGAPTAVSATPADSAANVAWTAPADNGSAITGYTVTASPGGKTVTVGGDVLGANVPDLTNGTAYTFTVLATNAAGDGPASAASDAVTPRTVPGAPTGVTATRGDGKATVSWTPPASDGGAPVTGYLVTSSPDGKTAAVNGPGTSADVIGLTNGTAYTFTVEAVNEAGSSAASAPSPAVTPAGVPTAPGAVSGTPGQTSVTVSWTAAGGNGSPVTSYTVTGMPGNLTKTVTGLSTTFTGLTNGTAYTFTVTATNAVGTGAGKTSDPVTPTWVTGLTETATKAVVSGGTARLSGKLTRSDGTGLVGAPVKIYRRVAPATTYTFVRTVTTGAGGAWSTSFTVTKNTRFQAKFAGTEGYGASVSPVRLTTAAYRVSAAYALAGRTATVTGSIAPNASGRTVYLRHRRADGSYYNVGSAVVGADGKYKIVRTFPRGSYSLSVYIPASSTNVAGKTAQRATTFS